MTSRRTQVVLLGGGQLGRMLGQAAARLDVELTVIDPTAECPAAATAHRQVVAPFTDFDAVVEAGRGADVVTVEIEHVSIPALRELEGLGIPVRPAAAVLETIGDKLSQRRRLAEAGVPGPRFTALPGGDALAGDAPVGARDLGLPAMQKLRYGGYDGRGVALVEEAGFESGLPLAGPSYLEEAVEIATELAVLVARRPSGEVAVYPPVEMAMDPELNLVDAVVYPAEVPEEISAEARRVARAAVEATGGVGINAVELFVTQDGAVLVNEIAPRPHNSGHLTIETADTDQFEQHLRAVLDLPLGSTTMRGAAVMRNLLGTEPEGPTTYDGLDRALAVSGAHVHLYGKRISRPGRKMGHLTVCRADPAEAKSAAAEAAAAIRISGELPAGG